MTAQTPTEPGTLSRRQRRRVEELGQRRPWAGPNRHYDILRELSVATVVVVILTFALALTFSSPDEAPVTVRDWASATPSQFLTTALSELQGTSTSSTYGPPYNHGDGSTQSLGGISPQKLLGVTIPLRPAQAFVLHPLSLVPGQSPLHVALSKFEGASKAQQATWEAAYAKALAKGKVPAPSEVRSSGPLGVMMPALLAMAKSGALDAALTAHGRYYTENYTKPIMFIGDGATGPQADSSYWSHIITAEHLQGDQWGMMNETGSWPGQPWLWLYTLWYQVPPMNGSANGDLMVIAIMTLLSLGLLFVPFIPILRSVPRMIPIHRLIWKSWYRRDTQANH